MTTPIPLSRIASHAGSWYPESEVRLTNDLDRWLNEAHQPISAGQQQQEEEEEKENWTCIPTPCPLKNCRAIIAPHAGYSYSGSAAAWAYKLIDPSTIKRVFILGPSHHVYLDECALTRCTEYETPLGNLKIDTTINEELHQKGNFQEMTAQTDEEEHSIELHLPYIKHIFKNQDISIVPILVGSLSSKKERQYGGILAPYLANKDNFFIISSDFCHWGTRFSYTYGSKRGAEGGIYERIAALDRAGMERISDPNVTQGYENFKEYLRETKNTICGRYPISILLCSLIHLSNSSCIPELKFVRYQQSNLCRSLSHSSVSYAAAYLSLSSS